MADITKLPIRLTSSTEQELFEESIANVGNLTDKITNVNEATIMGAMLRIWSALLSTGLYHVSARAAEMTVDYVRQRANGVRVYRVIGYDMYRVSPARVNLEFTPAGGLTKTAAIRPYYDASPTIVFPTSASLPFCCTGYYRVLAGSLNTVTVPFVQGNPASRTFVATTAQDQEYTLQDANVAQGSIRVEVNGVLYSPVTGWHEASPDSLVYREFTDEDGLVHIQFGDGNFGQIPSGTITVYFFTTLGPQGNDINVGRITQLASAITDFDGGALSTTVTVTNPERSSGGTTAESLIHAKKNASRVYASKNRVVTEEDFLSQVESFPGIKQAAALGVEDFGEDNVIVSYFETQIPIIPDNGGLPSQALKTALNDYLNQIKIKADIVHVVDPEYTYVDVRVDIFVSKLGPANSVVKENVETAIEEFFTIAESPSADIRTVGRPSGLVFGERIFASRLIDAIQDVEGVVGIDYIEPSTTVSVEPTSIAVLANGSPIVNVVGRL